MMPIYFFFNDETNQNKHFSLVLTLTQSIFLLFLIFIICIIWLEIIHMMCKRTSQKLVWKIIYIGRRTIYLVAFYFNHFIVFQRLTSQLTQWNWYNVILFRPKVNRNTKRICVYAQWILKIKRKKWDILRPATRIGEQKKKKSKQMSRFPHRFGCVVCVCVLSHLTSIKQWDAHQTTAHKR